MQSLRRLGPGVVTLKGLLGQTLARVIKGRLKTVDYKRMVEPFRNRDEGDGGWRDEFWGKIVRSTVFAYYSTQDPELKTILDATVDDLLSTQTEDGRIASYTPETQVGGFCDLWGRKYVLYALADYYEYVNPRQDVLTAMTRLLDDLLQQSGGNLHLYGGHDGLMASSMLRGIVRMYQFTGRQDYLAVARRIMHIGCTQKDNVFEQALQGVSPKDIADGKAYELTSCFQGLAGMYELLHEGDMMTALTLYWKAVRDEEICITGGGGMGDRAGEFWYNGKINQVREDCGAHNETCVSATWIGFCKDMLQLTCDAAVADELERTFYNTMAGAFNPSGSSCTHQNPVLTGGGYKVEPTDQMQRCRMAPFDGHDCCRAQGPYGLSLAPLLAIMGTEDGYAVNFYEDAEAKGILKIEGGFPGKGNVRITVLQEGNFALWMRIPKEYACVVDGVKPVAGTYYRMQRIWKAGDTVELVFDLAPRKVLSPCRNFQATVCGPLVMATYNDKLPHTPVLQCGDLIDYASAGSNFTPEDTLQVWFPVEK